MSNKYDELVEAYSNLKQENESLQQNNKILNDELVALTTSHNDLLSYKNVIEPEVEINKTKISELQDKIKSYELRRFASAYFDQESKYREEQNLWFKYVIGSVVLITISILFSIYHPYLEISNKWYDEPGLYLLNAVFVTIFIYSLKKYSHLGNLIIDYANRKTLAQSYQYLVESEDELSELDNKFLEKVSSIFTANPVALDSKVTMYEQLLDNIESAIKSVVPK
ncbi:MAG TPA: hypothetical protein VGC58_02070 [Candidatus Paceibacterota bacterium]